MSPDVDQLIMPHEEGLESIFLLLEVDAVTVCDVVIFQILRCFVDRPNKSFESVPFRMVLYSGGRIPLC